MGPPWRIDPMTHHTTELHFAPSYSQILHFINEVIKILLIVKYILIIICTLPVYSLKINDTQQIFINSYTDYFMGGGGGGGRHVVT